VFSEYLGIRVAIWPLMGLHTAQKPGRRASGPTPLVTLNVPKRSVAFYFSPDFRAPLTLFTRRTTVYLRDQHVRDQILSDERRLLFLHGSAYEQDPAKRQQKTLLEARMRSVLGNPAKALLTARYGDVASSLRQH
jgi:hypothetical protein